MMNGITNMKQSTIKIVADKIVYFDPYLIPGEPKDADFIFISHPHGDHLSIEDIQKIAKADTKIVVTKDGLEELTEAGNTNVLGVIPFESYEWEGLIFETVPAYNINKKFHTRESNWVGYILTMNGTRYYFAGDTDFIPEMASIHADVAFLPVGGTYTMTAKEAAEAANTIKPKVAVPIHFGDIVGTEEDAKTFLSLLEAPIQGMILKQ